MNKAFIPFAIAIAIPVALVSVMLIAVYVPQSTLKPTHNFVYSDNRDNYGSYIIDVKDQHITITPRYPDSGSVVRSPNFFMYDFSTDTVRKLSDAEVQNLKIDDQPIKDGYQVTKPDRSDSYGLIPSLFFGGSRSDDLVLKKGKSQKSLEIPTSNFYDYEFVGWVID